MILDKFVKIAVRHVFEDKEKILVGFANYLLQLDYVPVLIGT
jgi:hypothetical protein